MAVLAMVAPFKSHKVPPKAPIAVRQADTITTSLMVGKPPEFPECMKIRRITH
jgi:hypothetical protein